MTLVLVTARTDIAEYYKNMVGALGVVVHYNHPIKALDNLDELSPRVILWSYHDFPRHWKTTKAYLDAHSIEADFFLVSDDQLPSDEAKKVEGLGMLGTWVRGFFDDELMEAIKLSLRPPTLDHELGETTQVVPLPGYQLSMLQDGRGIYLFASFKASKTDIRSVLSSIPCVELPRTGARAKVHLTPELGSLVGAMELEALVESVDPDGNTKLRLLKIPEAYLDLLAPKHQQKKTK